MFLKISVVLNEHSRTIDAHRYYIMQKLNVKNTAEMVIFSLENKILSS